MAYDAVWIHTTNASPMTSRTSSLTDSLFAKLQGRIESGLLAPGEQLPTQKDISASEGVSRTVVREAVARLEAQGLVVSRQGSGVYVAKSARYRAFQVTHEELSQLPEVIRLLEVRQALESEMAALAAQRRTPDNLASMREALVMMQRVSDDPQASSVADAAFHIAIARATKNDYFVRLIDFLGVRLVPPRTLYLRDAPRPDHAAYAAKVRDEHDAILDAIACKEPTRARAAARHHMEESLIRHRALADQQPAAVAE